MQSAARFALFLARAADSFLAMKRTNLTTKSTRARAIASTADGHVRAVLMAALTGFALLAAAVVVAPRAHGQVFNSQPYTAAPDPAVEQLRQRVEQLEADLRKATDRAEVLGAQLSDARRTADEANNGRKKLETDLTALRDRVEMLEDAAGGPVAAGGGSAALPTTLQTAQSVDLTGSVNNASPAPAARVDLAALPQDEEGFFNSAHALLLGGDFPGSGRLSPASSPNFPKAPRPQTPSITWADPALSGQLRRRFGRLCQADQILSSLAECRDRHGEAGAGDARDGQDIRQLQDAGRDGEAVSEGIRRRQTDGRAGTPVRQVFLTVCP